jgi:hypothetical protein
MQPSFQQHGLTISREKQMLTPTLTNTNPLSTAASYFQPISSATLSVRRNSPLLTPLAIRDGAATEDTKDQITISKVIALSTSDQKSHTNVLPLHQLKPLLPRRRMSHTRKRTSTLRQQILVELNKQTWHTTAATSAFMFPEELATSSNTTVRHRSFKRLKGFKGLNGLKGRTRLRLPVHSSSTPSLPSLPSLPMVQRHPPPTILFQSLSQLALPVRNSFWTKMSTLRRTTTFPARSPNPCPVPLALTKKWQVLVKVYKFAHLSIGIYQHRDRASAVIARAWLQYRRSAQQEQQRRRVDTPEVTEVEDDETAQRRTPLSVKSTSSLYLDEVAASFPHIRMQPFVRRAFHKVRRRDGWIYPCSLCSNQTWRLGYPKRNTNSHPVYVCANCYRDNDVQRLYSRSKQIEDVETKKELESSTAKETKEELERNTNKILRRSYSMTDATVANATVTNARREKASPLPAEPISRQHFVYLRARQLKETFGQVKKGDSREA